MERVVTMGWRTLVGVSQIPLLYLNYLSNLSQRLYVLSRTPLWKSLFGGHAIYFVVYLGSNSILVLKIIYC